ncbi:MAG: MFS transporter permease [bacterium]|nr:MFS transporter permease [bacterium]
MFELYDYSLSDLLLFSRETYLRLLGRYNADMWPSQIAMMILGGTLIGLVRSSKLTSDRVISVLLAAIWLWVAYGFHIERYATIQIAAKTFAVMFIIQAILLVLIGVIGVRIHFSLSGGLINRTGLGLVCLGVFVYPLAGWAAGREWGQVELFALMPDPTVVATFGFLLMTGPRPNGLLLIIPVLWTVVSGALSWEMGAYESLLAPATALLTVSLSLVQYMQSVSK